MTLRSEKTISIHEEIEIRQIKFLYIRSRTKERLNLNQMCCHPFLA